MTHACIDCEGPCDCLWGEFNPVQCDGCGCGLGFILFADPDQANDDDEGESIPCD